MHQRASPSCHRAIGTLSLALITSIKHTHTWRWAGGTLQRIVCLLVISFAVWKIVGISVIENHKVFQSILNPVNCIGLQWVQINRAIRFSSILLFGSSHLFFDASILPFDSSHRLSSFSFMSETMGHTLRHCMTPNQHAYWYAYWQSGVCQAIWIRYWSLFDYAVYRWVLIEKFLMSWFYPLDSIQ